MPLSLLFWIIYILTIVGGVWSYYDSAQPLWYRRFGGYLILWILVGILGYRVFGAAIK